MHLKKNLWQIALIAIIAVATIFGGMTATPALADAAPTPTTDMVDSCLAQIDISGSVFMDYEVATNMDVGDPSLWSVVTGADAFGGNKFVAIVEPMWNLDFEAPIIHGMMLQTNSVDLKVLTCTAEEMAKKDNAALLYIGNQKAPEGWLTEKDLPLEGWVMSVWKYDETPIEIKGAIWDDAQFAELDYGNVIGDKAKWVYAQWWDSVDASMLYHLITEPGCALTAPKTGLTLQGTYWLIKAGDEIPVPRFVQMSQKEVASRDADKETGEKPTIVGIYVGKMNPPTGWSNVLPAGWSATCDGKAFVPPAAPTAKPTLAAPAPTKTLAPTKAAASNCPNDEGELVYTPGSKITTQDGVEHVCKDGVWTPPFPDAPTATLTATPTATRAIDATATKTLIATAVPTATKQLAPVGQVVARPLLNQVGQICGIGLLILAAGGLIILGVLRLRRR